MTLIDRIEAFAERQSREATVIWQRDPTPETWRRVMQTALALRQVREWLPRSPDHTPIAGI